ncbi:MAG: hypothetical protein ACJA2S_001216 [Cyclobacteriaceae bacterium]|jgi:hypothetical protein
MRELMKNIFFLLIGLFAFSDLFSQTCTATITSDTDFDAISWTGGPDGNGTTCGQMASGTEFNGDVVVDVDNNIEITVRNNVDIVGSFPITGGPGSGFTVDGGGAGITFQVSEDIGDNGNNGVLYSVPNTNDVMNADGTFYGKNNSDFSGSGTISGGTLNVKNGSTCPSPCPITNNFNDCINGSGQTFCDDNNVILPIVLGRFELVKLERSVELEWQTITEENFDFFSIERSEDGENFYEIGTVPGHGNSNDPIDYSFVDKNPLFGTSFYRLNAIDYDGTYEKFQILPVEFIPPDLQVSIYPNPGNNNNMKLRLGLPTEAKIKTVSVYNLSGEQILEKILTTGQNELDLSSRMQKGFYFAKIHIDNYTITKKLIIN